MTHIYTESEFKEIERGEYNLDLDRTDRNGTKYFSGVQRCWKCDGVKRIDVYSHVSDGVCFACNGSGVNPCKVRVMTDEYAEKLTKKRQAKAAKNREKDLAEKAEIDKINAEILAKYGFNSDGKGWLSVDREKIGFQYKEGVYIMSAQKGDCCEISAADCAFKNSNGIYIENEKGLCFNFAIDNLARNIREDRKTKESCFYGKIGDKFENIEAVLKNWFTFDSAYGIMYIYIFEDESNHCFKWVTSKGIPQDKGEKVTIKGTIKDHALYAGQKQTVITRCKID